MQSNGGGTRTQDEDPNSAPEYHLSRERLVGFK